MIEMEPRILLLMGEEYAHVELLHNEDSPYSFVRYTDSMKAEAVEEFLLRESSEYDSVATFNLADYADIREVVERAYRGKKILFITAAASQSYMNEDKKYEIAVRIPIKPSAFDKIIEREFKKL